MTTSTPGAAGSPTSGRTPPWSGTWTWTFTGADGGAVLPDLAEPSAPPEHGFTAQADAETWVGLQWRALVAAGAEAAVLQRDGARVYGPMPLRPAGPGSPGASGGGSGAAAAPA